MNLTYRPLSLWTAPTTPRRRSDPYRSDWRTTMKKLGVELTQLKARYPVLQLMVAETDIRADGTGLLAHRKPTHPGVVLSFESKTGPLTVPCDSCTEWRDNVHSIALGLERLRDIDRYGISPRGEQYQGWKQLPPGTATPVATMTLLEAATFMAEYSTPLGADRGAWRNKLAVGDPDDVALAFRRASRQLHPDVNPDKGEDLFRHLQDARAVLLDGAG